MSSFTDPLFLTPLPAAGIWRTTRAFEFHIGALPSTLVVAIPAGTETDLGTVPWFVSWVIRPHDPAAAAAYVVHDDLCRRADFSRFMADAIFLHALLVLGVPIWRSVMAFVGVRAVALVSGK